MARDCVVKVQWTGDADIDVMVKEPAGTVCSLRNQRTTSGGMLVGDLSSDDKASIEGHVAVYCLPEGLQRQLPTLDPPGLRQVDHRQSLGRGDYALQHHRWPRSCEKKIPLDSGEALVKFDVADGRRKESIQEQQVVNAAVAAVAQANMTRHRGDPGPAACRGERPAARPRPWLRSSRPRRPHRPASRSRSTPWPSLRPGPTGCTARWATSRSSSPCPKART